MDWPERAKRWSDAEQAADAALAREAFSRRRLDKPADGYRTAYAEIATAYRGLLLGARLEETGLALADLATHQTTFTSLRYPGFSADFRG